MSAQHLHGIMINVPFIILKNAGVDNPPGPIILSVIKPLCPPSHTLIVPPVLEQVS